MLARPLIFTAAALLLLSTGHVRIARPDDPTAVAPATSASRGLLEEIDRELAREKTTSYSHKTHVDEEEGTFDFDCSGFVDYALARVDPDALLPLRKGSRHARPLAEDFVRVLEKAPTGERAGEHWARVARVDALLPGDVIAWRVSPEAKANGNKNTGHVMVVHGPVARNKEDRKELLVPIADSTLHGHAQDSREKDENGIGTGTIGLVTDESGAPVSYKWAGGVSKTAVATTIVLGRLER